MTAYKAFAAPRADPEVLADHQTSPWQVVSLDPSKWENVGYANDYIEDQDLLDELGIEDYDSPRKELKRHAESEGLQAFLQAHGCATVRASDAVLFMTPDTMEREYGSSGAQARARAKQAMLKDLLMYEAWTSGTILYVSLIPTKKYPGLILICPDYDERYNAPEEFDEDEYAEDWLDTTVVYSLEDARRVAQELLAARGQNVASRSRARGAKIDGRSKAPAKKIPAKAGKKQSKASTSKAAKKTASTSKKAKTATKATKSRSKASSTKKAATPKKAASKAKVARKGAR